MSKTAVLFISGLLAQMHSTNGAIISRASPDFGVCVNPTIDYVQDQDGMLGYGYKPSNTADFPHGASPDIRAITDYICSNLQNSCRAPSATHDLCKAAATATDGKEGKDAADAFNNAINASSPPPSLSSETGSPQITVEPRLNVKFSKETVTFDGHIDPIWWFNEYLKADGRPALCDETQRRMPDNHYLSFSCEGADDRIVPMMKAALIAIVEATIDNEAATDDERMFKHTEEVCLDEFSCNFNELYPKTVFPQSVHVAVAIDVPGSGGALSGNLRYTITSPMSQNCKLCSYLSTAGTGGAAGAKVREVIAETSKLVAPGVAIVSVLITFGCLTACG